MMKLTDKQLKGSFPPLVTPFKDDGSVDYDAYAKLVEFQVKDGTHGIVVTGTTGEPSILTTDERIELGKVAGQAAKKRIQVVAATGAQNHADTVKMTEAAEKAGADALLIVTPYFIRPPARSYPQMGMGRMYKPPAAGGFPGAFMDDGSGGANT